MQPNLPTFAFVLSSGLASCYATGSSYPKDATDILAGKGLRNLKGYLQTNPAQGGCTIETAAKRREW